MGCKTRQILLGGYLTLLASLIVPLYIKTPVSLQMMTISTVIITLGSITAAERERERQRQGPSADPRDVIGREQAYRFPLIASSALFGMFLAFKYLPKDWVSFLLTIYGIVFGGFAFAGLMAQVIERNFSKTLPKVFFKEFGHKNYLLMTLCDVLGIILSTPVMIWYYKTQHFLPNNLLACGLALSGIDLLAISDFKTSAILLSGLFFYDIFWVFGSKSVFGANVMVSVAKQFQGPIKLIFPQVPGAGPENTSMLGLGDIVIPGLFVALLFRFDLRNLDLNKSVPSISFKSTPYFITVIYAYFMGLVATYFALTIFKAAQPALLYLVPCCLLSVIALAYFKDELSDLLAYTEEEEEEEGKSKKDDDTSSISTTVTESKNMKDMTNDKTNLKNSKEIPTTNMEGESKKDQ